jgi:hypothetical protein
MATSLVVMGVSGSGKSTIARLLADRLGWPMAEADDFHPRSNIEKMTSGVPLDDEDRMPWLRSMRDWIGEHAADGLDTVVTCSALKRSYRDLLRGADADVLFVHLSGSRELLGGQRVLHVVVVGTGGVAVPPELAQPLGVVPDRIQIGQVRLTTAMRPPKPRLLVKKKYLPSGEIEGEYSKPAELILFPMFSGTLHLPLRFRER